MYHHATVNVVVGINARMMLVYSTATGLRHEPHSFLALDQAETGELMPHDGGLETDISLYVNDGQGAICCIKLNFLKLQCMYVCMYFMYLVTSYLWYPQFLTQHAVRRASLSCRMYN